MGALALAVAVVAAACGGSGAPTGTAVTTGAPAGGGAPAGPDAPYIQQILDARAAKDEAFRHQPDQPIPVGKEQTFLPLSYFAPDPAYAVTATFTPATGSAAIEMPTSTGLRRAMERVGTLEFTLKGRQLTLGAFVEAGSKTDRLFIPFSDLTSGTETYSAGRYMELDRSPSGIYVIDFNRAFHPFCYYNHDYDCPFPPASNRLPVPIRAGEKMAQSMIPAAGRSGQ